MSLMSAKLLTNDPDPDPDKLKHHLRYAMSRIFTSSTMNSTVLFILSSTFSLHKLSIALTENMLPVTSLNVREKSSQHS